MKTKLVGIFLFLLNPALYANDGNYTIQGTGGTVMPVKNDAIVMEREEIKIDVIPNAVNDFTVKYDCTFYFVNRKSSTQKVLVGFPHRYDANMTQEHNLESKAIAIKDFKFIVEEKEIKYQKFDALDNPELKTIPSYDVVYAIEVTFKAGEKKTIRNTYSLNKFINCIPNRQRGREETEETIEYILKTGASWKEPIGTAEILVTFHRPAHYFKIDAEPKSYVLSEEPYQLKYSFTDFVPTEDIKITFGLTALPFDAKKNQLKLFFDNKRYMDVYYLLWEWDIMTAWDKKDTGTKDFIRNTAYKTAYQFYNTDFETALALYFIALHHARSHTETDYLFIEYSEEFDDFYFKLSQWGHEEKDNSPCYYIVYNIACLYAKKGNYEKSKYWLEAAFQMKPDLREYAKKDPDLVFLYK